MSRCENGYVAGKKEMYDYRHTYPIIEHSRRILPSVLLFVAVGESGRRPHITASAVFL